MSNPTTREKIVLVADDLFYRHGFSNTSFADIAKAVQISRGNFYYHFKTKDEILEAVIALRLARTRQLLSEWENEAASPKERIKRFIGIMIMNRAKIARYGCPVGSLCTELAKLEHAAQDNASSLFELFRTWLRQQFVSAGRPDDADTLSMHLLAQSQGVATLAQAFGNEAFIDHETRQMNDWLDQEVVETVRT